MLAFAGPSGADVSEVSGSAFGYSASVSLFNGPPGVRGPVPRVTLPSTGSAAPVTAREASGQVVFGPAEMLKSGPLEVSTQGTPGPEGSVTSSASIAGVADGPGPFHYEQVTATCTAKETGVSGSATIAGGKLDIKYDKETEEPSETIALPANPAPNTVRTGTIDQVGDSYKVVLNEQIVDRSGKITVNAMHMELLGPSAVGDLIIGQVVCATTAGASSPAAAGSPPPPKAGTATTVRSGGQAGSATTVPGRAVAKTGTEAGPMLLAASALVVAGMTMLLFGGRRWVATGEHGANDRSLSARR